MRKCYFLFPFILFTSLVCNAQQIPKNEVWLLVRGDDMGSSHAANKGCIESYKEGIMRSVELMVPCPWFPEAVKLLNENPGLDVGLHLVLTSEWENMKWRPITYCPDLTDSNGYFYPMVWQREDFPPNTSLQKADWKIEEIEQELRAQINMGIRNVPHITHMGGHMGFAQLDPQISELMKKLAIEYNIDLDLSTYGASRFKGWGNAKSTEEKIDSMAYNLTNLKPGLYILIDHPAKDCPEMQAIWHKGYEDVAEDRESVLRVFTNDKIKGIIREKNIKLVSYKDLKELEK